MITIVDYGLGNIRAFDNIYKRLNMPVQIANDPSSLKTATKIILPGVGSFDWAMECLKVSGMRDQLDCLVLEKKIPVLGICVGMQIMANNSEEGNSPGLSWIDAKVCKFKNLDTSNPMVLPHMGWNRVVPNRKNCIFKNMSEEQYFYFLHSYYFLTSNSDTILSTSIYGEVFTSSVKYKNIFGVQFHPEKSHGAGIELLKNFAQQ